MYDEVLARFESVTGFRPVWRPQQQYWTVRCPAHPDRHPSATLRLSRKGHLLVRCHALRQCSFNDIIHALGLPLEAFNREDYVPCNTAPAPQAYNGEPEPNKKIVSIHPYCNETGCVLYETVRYEPKDFRQRRIVDGKYVWNLQDVRLIPYNLNKIIVSDISKTVCIFEGEKAADAASSLGLLATTNVCGAGKWRAEYCRYFTDRKVVIFPDNDEPGTCHAEQVKNLLASYAASIKVVDLPRLPEKGDIVDWLDGFGDSTKEDRVKALKSLIDAVPAQQKRKVIYSWMDNSCSFKKTDSDGDMFLAVRRQYLRAENCLMGDVGQDIVMRSLRVLSEMAAAAAEVIEARIREKPSSA